jgi:hypothetical protein
MQQRNGDIPRSDWIIDVTRIAAEQQLHKSLLRNKVSEKRLKTSRGRIGAPCRQ